MKNLMISLLTAIALAVFPAESLGATPEEVAAKTTPRKQCDAPVGNIKVSFSNETLNEIESGDTVVNNPQSVVLKTLLETGCFTEGAGGYTFHVKSFKTKVSQTGDYILAAKAKVDGIMSATISNGQSVVLSGRGVGTLGITVVLLFADQPKAEDVFASAVTTTVNNMELPSLAAHRPGAQKTAAVE